MLRAGFSPLPLRSERFVRRWFFGLCGFCVLLAGVGAWVRLSEAGLAIMEWAPISGLVPPLTAPEWQRVFALYQQTKEYQAQIPSLGLEEFRYIFWLEWGHRALARLFALLLVLSYPLAWRRLARAQRRVLVMASLLVGFQAVLGWYMVASGFGDREDVSHLRLLAHWATAVAVYTLLFSLALSLCVRAKGKDPPQRRLRVAVLCTMVLIYATLLSGGWVAGLDAGFIANSFPLIEGRWFPAGYGGGMDDPLTAQVYHRYLALITLACAVASWALGARRRSGGQRWPLRLLALAAVAQVALGVATLLLRVPTPLGIAHQAGAWALLSVGLWNCWQHCCWQRRGAGSGNRTRTTTLGRL